MILPVVEGHGEMTAVPVLIRRIVAAYSPETAVAVAKPIRVKRDLLLKEQGIENAVELAARQTSPEDGILVLIDADDADCVATLAEELRSRARACRPDRHIRVVVANREFEAWFLASAPSLASRRGLPAVLDSPDNPEAIRDAKRWLSDRAARGQSYKPTIDQAAFAQLFDMDLAYARARSFRKFVQDVVDLANQQPQ